MLRCPKCNGWWNAGAFDEHGDADPHCVSCGYRPARVPSDEESGAVLPDGKRRTNKVRHGGLAI